MFFELAHRPFKGYLVPSTNCRALVTGVQRIFAFAFAPWVSFFYDMWCGRDETHRLYPIFRLRRLLLAVDGLFLRHGESTIERFFAYFYPNMILTCRAPFLSFMRQFSFLLTFSMSENWKSGRTKYSDRSSSEVSRHVTAFLRSY